MEVANQLILVGAGLIALSLLTSFVTIIPVGHVGVERREGRVELDDAGEACFHRSYGSACPNASLGEHDRPAEYLTARRPAPRRAVRGRGRSG